MEPILEVRLHVYDLIPEDTPTSGGAGGGNNRNHHGNAFLRMFSRTVLPMVGMGAYHTSLEIDGFVYVYAANVGITKTKLTSTITPETMVPPQMATYRESIYLGSCQRTRTEIHEIVRNLQSNSFGPQSYHLVHRNCNHFTETFATALLLYDQLILDYQQQQQKSSSSSLHRLKTYPTWINRLAYSSSSMIAHDIDIVPCQVIAEAQMAIDAKNKVTWAFPDNTTSHKQPPPNNNKKNASSSAAKKQLTEAQKEALAKIRKGTGTLSRAKN
jgi:hypothetical protein